MGFDPADFGAETVTDTSGIARAERTVSMPTCTDDGYATVETKQFYYRNGDEYTCVQQTSNGGWSVWRYTEAGNEYTPLQRHGAQLSCQQAQRLARRVAENPDVTAGPKALSD